MILADKIIMLRKKSGQSQEELAEKLNVSRQSISKWEGAQSIPDLNKILAMAQIFDVSTDFLLKEELEVPDGQNANTPAEDVPPVRHVSMEMANRFLAIKERTAKTVAFAAYLCILSPICLILLGGMTTVESFNLNENLAGGIGLIVLLIMVAFAVMMFIRSGNQTSEFEFLEKEPIETEYGVSGMVAERRNKYRAKYNNYNIIGTMLCILSVIPLLAGAFAEGLPNSDLMAIIGLCVMMAVAGIGVIFFIVGGMNWASMQKLLQEGEYTKESKSGNGIGEIVGTVYWLIATAVYLAWSFAANSWYISWIVWVIAGVLFPVVLTVAKRISDNKNK